MFQVYCILLHHTFLGCVFECMPAISPYLLLESLRRSMLHLSPPNHKFRGWEFFEFCLCGHGSSYTQRPRFELSIQFEDNELTIVVFFGGGYIHFWAKHAKNVCWSLFVYVCLLFLFPSCFFPFATKNTHVAARVFNGDQWQKPKFVQIQWLKLVGGLEHFLFFHILGIIIPTDLYFSEG